MTDSKDLAICGTCGTQYDFAAVDAPELCRMCEDPRQFVPPTGQVWTSMNELNLNYKTRIIQDEVNSHVWSIFSSPQAAIGQRTIFLETPAGNVLWDCIANLDQETIDWIKARGGVKAMAISHPHFYTTHLDWAMRFNCAVYLAEDILPGVTAVKLGGHFPDSMVLHWDNSIYTGDTIGISMSALHSPRLKKRQPGSQTFFFQWAFPNFIPLGPDDMLKMWKRLQPWNFDTVHSLFHGYHIRDSSVKEMILESMKLQARHMDSQDHALMKEVGH